MLSVDTAGTESAFWFFVFPLILIASLVTMLAIYLIFERIREIKYHRYVAAHKCVICGYDLRSKHERCPDCGAPVGRNDQREHH
jgi:uncharacterized paraquat-inducible protein A